MTVTPLQGITHACFGLSYAIALLLELARLAWPATGWRWAALGLGFAGLLAHTAFITSNQPDPSAPYGSMLLLAWVLALFYLYGTVHYARQAWAIFVLPVVIGLVGLSLAMTASASTQPTIDLPPWLSGERFWGMIHGILILLASVGVSVGFLASVMYLVQARRLRFKMNPASSMPMLSLERLETMNRRAVNAAFPLLTVGPARGHAAPASRTGHDGRVAFVEGAEHVGAVGALSGSLLSPLRSPRSRQATGGVVDRGIRAVDRLAGGSPPLRAGGAEVNLRAIGCNFQTAGLEIREQLAIEPGRIPAVLAELSARYAAEAAVVNTCNRVEIYLARPDMGTSVSAALVAEFLGEARGLAGNELLPHLYERSDAAAVRHLFRVAGGLDSMVVGEGQIAGQVREAFETARSCSATGPILNALFSSALRVSKRIRSETGLGSGQISMSSAAVEFVKEVFNHFTDKTVLVIGAGKMGRLTLNQIAALKPARILVTNRNPEKALALCAECGGKAIAWEQLDDALVQSDIVLSTTGSAQPIMPARRFAERVSARRGGGGTMVVFDLAVPRDFDPAIHDGDRVCVFNVDDLARVTDRWASDRRKHIAPAEAIVEAEVRAFVADYDRRRDGPVIGQLTSGADRIRGEVVNPLLDRFDGKLTAEDRAYIEGAFRLFQNRMLHGPIAALREESKAGRSGSLRDALMKLFGLTG